MTIAVGAVGYLAAGARPQMYFLTVRAFAWISQYKTICNFANGPTF